MIKIDCQTHYCSENEHCKILHTLRRLNLSGDRSNLRFLKDRSQMYASAYTLNTGGQTVFEQCNNCRKQKIIDLVQKLQDG